MKILQLLEHNEIAFLRTKFQHHPQFGYIQKAASFAYGYRVDLDGKDLKKLLINSSPRTPKPTRSDEYPAIGDAISEIQRNPQFLKSTILNDGLSGTKVQEKLQQFQIGQSPLIDDCFIVDANLLLPGRRGELYVLDGMHRLVAYALWSKLQAVYFPITLLYFSNQLHIT